MDRAERPPAPRVTGAPSFQFLRVLFALIMRDMSTKYARGTGGYLWAVASPVLAIAVMSVVFSLMFRTPSLGSSFILFYTSGYVPFHMYLEVHNGVMGAIRQNRSLMQYPAVTPMDAILARAILAFLTHVIIGTIILTGALSLTQTPVNIDLVPLTEAMLSAAFLGLAMGSVNCVLVAFFPTWERIWRVITTPLFIVSGILYTYEEAPRMFQELLWFNPLVHVTALMRTGIYGAYRGAFIEMPYVWGISCVLALVGLYLVRRHRSTIINPRY